MLTHLEYLNFPVKIIGIVVIFLVVSNLIGEILEFKGKVVPEFIKIRKYFARKKKEKETLRQVPNALKEVKKTLDEFNKHYSKDNIRMRDKWIENVNHKLEKNDELIRELSRKLDKNNEDTLSLLIDSKRDTIINFAAFVINEKNPVTREQFNRIFKLYSEYEDIITNNNLTNGEADIAYRIITESYEKHMKDNAFVENVRGYLN
jgi:hypothetical protein